MDHPLAEPASAIKTKPRPPQLFSVVLQTWLILFGAGLLIESFIGALVVFLWLGLAAVALGQIFYFLWLALFRKNLKPLGSAGVILMCVGLWYVPQTHLLSPALHLLWKQSDYNAVISGQTRCWDFPGCHDDFSESGNLVLGRVAFSWGGFLDNWSGVCHDPTRKIENVKLLKRDYSNIDDPDIREATDMFGGTLIRALPLWGHWYYCGFT